MKEEYAEYEIRPNPVSYIDDLDTKLARLEREAALAQRAYDDLKRQYDAVTEKTDELINELQLSVVRLRLENSGLKAQLRVAGIT